jgi:hypothetical protein
MKRVLALEQRIRDYVNGASLYDRYFKTHLDEWNALCVALDTLGDSCLALGYYEASGIGEHVGEKYLKLYGLLQAIFLQQDSIRQLHLVFLGSDLQPSSDSAWKKIRELRNLTVGHPVEKKDKAGTKRCFISRVTIHSGGFQLLIWNSDKGQNEFEDVDLESLYEEYESEAIGHLESIAQAQIKRWGSLQISSSAR